MLLKIIWLSFFSICSYASTNDYDLITSVYYSLKRYDTSLYQSNITYLQSHLIHPILEYYFLISQLKNSNPPLNRIHEFINNNQSLLLSMRMREHLLEYYANQNNWNKVIEIYKATTDEKSNCLYLQAQYINNLVFDVALIEQLWLAEKQQPTACEYIFRKGIENNVISSEHIWKKLLLAYSKSNHALVQQIKPLLKRKLQPYVEYLLNDDMNFNLLQKAPKTIRHDLIFSLSVKLAKNKPEEFHSIMKKSSFLELPQMYKDELMNQWILSLANKRMPLLEKLNLPKNLTIKTHEAIIRYWLWKKNWTNVKFFIEALPNSVQTSSIWQYWIARALVHTQQIHEAKKILINLAKNRDYYGFLASLILKQPPAINNETHDKSSLDIGNLQNQAPLLYIQALYQYKLIHEARKELRYWLLQLPQSQIQNVSLLLHEWGWHDEAIWVANKGGLINHISIRFPKMYQDLIEKLTKEFHIELAWIFALIRQESAFRTDVKSSRGAVGLMQLLPTTVKQYLKNKIEVNLLSKKLLHTQFNLSLGIQHFQALIKANQYNIVKAIAAYNAGQKMVNLWSTDNLPTDIWIETIPYLETREYVKNVITYYVIYQHLLHKQAKLDKLFQLN